MAQPERDDLIEHEQRSHLSRGVADRLEKLSLDGRHAHPVRHHIEQHRSQPAAAAPDRSAGALGVVERDDAHLVFHRCRRAGGVAHRRRRRRIAPVRGIGRLARLGVVVRAVVGAFHLDDIRPPGVGAGRLQGGHHRLGARVAEADELEALDTPAQQLGQLHLGVIGKRERRAPQHALLHRGGNRRIGMADDDGRKVVVAVQVAVAVHVGHPRSLAMIDVDGVPALAQQRVPRRPVSDRPPRTLVQRRRVIRAPRPRPGHRRRHRRCASSTIVQVCHRSRRPSGLPHPGRRSCVVVRCQLRVDALHR